MKIVYMGTPDFAVGPLRALIEAGHEVTAVVCQPDRPKGRSGALVACPVKECALSYGIPVFQPERIKRPEAVEQLRSYPADVFVVAAFGQILSEEILSMPRYGCINIHASLLPKYRGSAPIQWAVINGEKKSGVTIMQMDKGIDTGDILLQEEVELAEEESGGSLFEKLAVCGSALIVRALEALQKGELKAVKQKEEDAVYARMLKKEDGLIDWKMDAEQIEQLVRGLDPWPGSFSSWNGKMLKFWKVKAQNGSVGENAAAALPGMVCSVTKDGFGVACGKGILLVKELQMEGKKRMNAADFLRGVPLKTGERLG